MAGFLSRGVKVPVSPGRERARKALPGLTLTCQQELMWCWAAVTQAVESARGTIVSQSDIASSHLAPGLVPLACVHPLPKPGETPRCASCISMGGCGSAHSLRNVLTERGRLAPNSAHTGAPSFERIQESIDAGRPMPIRIAWLDEQGAATPEGHFVCVIGYGLDDKGAAQVTVFDPLVPGVAMGAAGETEMSYEDLLDYRSSGGAKGTPNFHYEVT